MRATVMATGTVCVWLALFSVRVCAQEFRVYTNIQRIDESGDGNRDSSQAQIIARSLTLFHAGKAYDYIDAVGELTVFEPARKQFTILNGSRMLATTLTWDQLAELQRIGEGETKDYIRQLRVKKSGKYLPLIETLQSQLSPDFNERYDAESERLSLLGKRLSYHVKCADAAIPDAVETYLRYADWTARLNYVLHSHSSLPASRVKLNDSLRAKNKIPIEVELVANLDRPVRLRAEHRIHWDLSAKDRSYIHHWESQLRNQNVRHVSFRAYQQTTLVADKNH